METINFVEEKRRRNMERLKAARNKLDEMAKECDSMEAVGAGSFLKSKRSLGVASRAFASKLVDPDGLTADQLFAAVSSRNNELQHAEKLKAVSCFGVNGRV